MKQHLTVVLTCLLLVSASGSAADRPPAGTDVTAQPTLEGTHWQAVELAGAPVPKLAAGREPYLTFDTSGRLAGSDGCNRVIGSYKLSGDAITFEQMGATRMACMEEEVTRVEAAFNAALKTAARFKVTADRLELLDAAGKPVAVFAAGQKESQSAAPQKLDGTSWRLVRFEGSDDLAFLPSDPAKYTITFAGNGRLMVRFDCNRGSGRWRSEGESLLTFGPLSMTRAKCAEGSLHDQMVKQWPHIRSYVFRDGHLFLALMADGGIYEFEPLPEKQP